MLFERVSILGVAHVDPPHRITSAALSERLLPTLTRLGMKPDLLESLSGIVARRWWDEGFQPSQAATLAAEKVLTETGVPREKVGVLMNTSVCRDFIEPSTACLVHGNLGLPPSCANFDVGNACLAFINGMQLAAALIDTGAIEYALIVDGESSRPPVESTIARLLREDCTATQFRDQFATLTLGSGAAAMILCREDLAPQGHRFRGMVQVAATQHNRLCRGQPDEMVTDTRALLVAGLELASHTWNLAGRELGWTADSLDHFVMHQVSQVHTAQLGMTLGIDLSRAHLTFPECGNVGPAAVPITLSKAVEAGAIRRGDRVGLLAIGSGLNCAMAELLW